MKVLFSQLKKYLPDLDADYKTVGDVFTEIGYMQDGPAEEVSYKGKKDYFIDLEVRQNRGDLFGVINIAKELSAYYTIPLKSPLHKQIQETNYNLPIKVTATDFVKRVMAVKISGVSINDSPNWLRAYLDLYGINSVNNLVDLTNYVMLETGHSSHAFDTSLVGSDSLIWEVNPGYKTFTTLAGELLELSDTTVVISNGKKPLSLLMIGGKEVGINSNTKDIILEMAVYDPGLVRRNSKNLKISTEAGSRLEKHLDPETIPDAFNYLVNLILENCGGKVISKIYDNYLQKLVKKEITLDLEYVNRLSGMHIDFYTQKTYLQRLGFEIITSNEQEIKVLRPDNRLDIEQPEDVAEEIIRLEGFYKIPKDVLVIKNTKDVTPPHLRLIDSIKSILSTNGLDEVRSNVLIGESQNALTINHVSEVATQNSVNEEFPILRQSISVSLVNQLKERTKQFFKYIHLFEVGKVFFSEGTSFSEKYAVGIVLNTKELPALQSHVERLLNTLGIEHINYKQQIEFPAAAHPKHMYTIEANKQPIGTLFLLNEQMFPAACIAEIDIEVLNQITQSNTSSATQEIQQKLVTLDTNITLKDSDNIVDEVQKLLAKRRNLIWAWEVADEYKNETLVKYTVRVTYMHLSDQEAKQLHKEIFGE